VGLLTLPITHCFQPSFRTQILLLLPVLLGFAIKTPWFLFIPGCQMLVEASTPVSVLAGATQVRNLWIAALWLRTLPAAWSLGSLVSGLGSCGVCCLGFYHPNRHEKNGRLQFHRTYGLLFSGTAVGNACQFIGRYGADGQPRTDLRSAVLAFVGVVYAKTKSHRYPQGLLNPDGVYLWWVACWSWL